MKIEDGTDADDDTELEMEEGGAADMVEKGQAQTAGTRTPGDQSEGTRVGKGTVGGGPSQADMRNRRPGDRWTYLLDEQSLRCPRVHADGKLSTTVCRI